jgi:hypothetical protein
LHRAATRHWNVTGYRVVLIFCVGRPGPELYDISLPSTFFEAKESSLVLFGKCGYFLELDQPSDVYQSFRIASGLSNHNEVPL